MMTRIKELEELTQLRKELFSESNAKVKLERELTTTKIELAFQLEESLKEISDYKYALDESSILAITDQKGVIIHVNHNFCKISQYSAEELIGKDHRIINSGHHSKEFIRNLWVTISNGKIWRGELKNRARDGTYYWVETTIVPFLNNKGKPYRYAAIRADITTRKNAEDEVIRIYKEKESVLNRISDGVVSVDNDWRYTFLNDAALVDQPLGREMTLGKVIWDIHPEMRGTIFWDKYHEAMRTKKVVEMESFYAPMNIWFLVKIYPSSDGLTIFFKNVSERKNIELNLTRTMQEISHYKFALDEANIVAITDQKGVINYVNDNFCRISKYTRQELIGQDHRIINSGHHSKEFIKQIWLTIANGRVWRNEIKNKAKDGTIYWVDTTIVPFLDATGKPYQYVAIRSDITKRKVAEAEIAVLNEELEKRVKDRTEELESFSYSVSHDLRAPLRAINGYAQMLMEDKANQLDVETNRFVSNIIVNTTKMGHLIDDLLKFFRLGRKELAMLTIPMKDIVTNLCNEIMKDQGNPNLKFQINELQSAKGDQAAIKQVWINLISNAVKFSRLNENPIIEIGSEKIGNEIVYYIKDNGSGFDMRYSAKLFGVFQRLHTDEKFEGTGVGLAIVHRIITKHGGRVWGEAKINEGATFRFSLGIN